LSSFRGVSEDEAALEGIGGDGDVGARTGTVEVEDEVVGVRGGEDERSSFDWQDYGWLEEAGDFFGIGRAQGRRNVRLDGREADDDDGFGIVEGGRGVEAEVEGLAAGEGDGGNVLIFGDVKATHDADNVDDGADVGAVNSCAADLGVAGLIDEVGVGSVGEGVGDSLAVAIVEQALVAGLSETAGLGVEGLLEAIAVGLEVEGAGEEVGVVGEGLGVVGRNAADVGEIDLDAGLFESGLDEVLRGADEDAGAAADGGAEGGEVAAGFRGEEEDDLLGLGGDGDGNALFANLLVPGLNFGKPVVGGRVGGAAEEGGDQEVADGLGGGQVGVQPDFVSGLKIGNLGDGQSAAGTGDMDVNFGADEVEARRVGAQGRDEKEEGS